jgi:hypothetical protein
MNFKKVISTLVIAGVILTTGAVAFAAETTAGTESKGSRTVAEGKINKGGRKDKGLFGKGIMKNNIEENLKVLVSSGIITQGESDKLLALSTKESEARQAEMDKVKNMTEAERKAYFEAKKEDSVEKKGDILTLAVSEGILTQAKADSAKAKLQETRSAEKKAKLSEGLSSLVSSGTITKEQSDKILEYVSTIEASKPAKGTETPATEKTERKNPLSALVDNGTLTQAQLDAVSKVLPMGGGHGGHGKDRKVKASAGTTSSTATDATSSATVN